MPINGRSYDWEDVHIVLPSGTLIDVKEISYEDEKEIVPKYGKGGMPRGYGRGNYKATGKCKLMREEFQRMIALLGSYETPPLPIVVQFANDDQGNVTDLLKDCKFNKRSFAASSGSADVDVDLEFQVLGGIFAGGLPPQTLL